MSRTCFYNGHRVSVTWYHKYVGPNAPICERRTSVKYRSVKAQRNAKLRRLKANAATKQYNPSDEARATTNLLIDTVIRGCSKAGNAIEDFVGGNYKALLLCKA